MSIYDIKLLKRYLRDLPFEPCQKPTMANYMRGLTMPRSYGRDLQKICRHYGIGLKFKIVKRRQNAHSSYSYGYQGRLNGIIIRVAKDEPTFLSHDICRVFTHELAHHVQHTVLSEVCKKDRFPKQFKRRIRYERTAERLAYFIYKKYFAHLASLTHRNFTCYRKREEIEFLRSWMAKESK